MTNLIIKVNAKEPITFQATMKGLRKLATRKTYDPLKFRFEVLKQSRIEAKKWIYNMMNKAILQGFPRD